MHCSVHSIFWTWLILFKIIKTQMPKVVSADDFTSSMYQPYIAHYCVHQVHSIRMKKWSKRQEKKRIFAVPVIIQIVNCWSKKNVHFWTYSKYKPQITVLNSTPMGRLSQFILNHFFSSSKSNSARLLHDLPFIRRIATKKVFWFLFNVFTEVFVNW